MGITRIFILDDNGKKITCNQAAKLCGISASNVRYHMTTKGVTTVKELMEIKKLIRMNGTQAFSKQLEYETKFGMLTIKEMHEIHPHKDVVNLFALRSRVHLRGGMDDLIWKPPQYTKNPKSTKTCYSCKCRLPVVNYSHNTAKRDGYEDDCKMCRNDKAKKRYAGKKTTNRGVRNVMPGQIVMSEGKKYYVSECHSMRNKKGKVAALRIMSNGDVLRRTNVDLGSNWELVA